MRICKACGVEKPLTEFHRNVASKDGRRRTCKPCLLARQSEATKRREAEGRYSDERARAWFMARVYPHPNGCWGWDGYHDAKGYTVAVFGSSEAAYRLGYRVFVGPVPEGLELDHLCNNPSCVNYRHLQPVTHEENMRRAAMRRTHCKRGHELSGWNVSSNGPGKRTCRICRYAATNERRRAA